MISITIALFFYFIPFYYYYYFYYYCQRNLSMVLLRSHTLYLKIDKTSWTFSAKIEITPPPSSLDNLDTIEIREYYLFIFISFCI